MGVPPATSPPVAAAYPINGGMAPTKAPTEGTNVRVCAY